MLDDIDFFGKYHKAIEQMGMDNNTAKIEALVDMGNGIDNRCEIVDVIYDENSNTVVIYVDGRKLEY